jgi:hypothetical protein
MRKVQLGKIVPVVTQKTVSKKTEQLEEVTVWRIEASESDGVLAIIEELPETLVLWKTIPAEIQTLIEERIKAVLDNPAIVDEEEVVKG